jgi:hypothetical protein
MSQQDEAIGDGKFSIMMKALKAVILFPALTTPCLVKNDGVMTVVVALHKDHFGSVKAGVRKHSKGEKISLSTAVRFHSHLSLVPWGNAVCDPVYDEKHALSHSLDLRRECYMIYYSHEGAILAHDGAKPPVSYKGWYLQELPEKGETLVALFDHDESGQFPFGTLHNAATQMYYENGYTHLFQLNLAGIPHRGKELYELSWLYYDHDALIHSPDLFKREEYLRYRPNDNLLTKILEDGLKKSEEKEVEDIQCTVTTVIIPPVNPQTENEKNRLLKPNIDTSWRPGIVDMQPAKLNEYRLQQPGERILPDPEKPDAKLFPYMLENPASNHTRLDKPHTSIARDKVAFITQKEAPLIRSRHPVLFSEKEDFAVGVMSDLHVSSRQTLFKFSGAQTIHGADPADSPYIGPLAHDALQSTADLFQQISEQSDMLVITGDLYDHTRNCNPAACIDQIQTTGDLWQFMDYQNYRKNYAVYPPRIDGLMALSLILENYQRHRKPVFFVSGNHEAYGHPYGTSPRVVDDTMLKANDAISAEMNLTFYEATLLYGENFHRYVTPFNFDQQNMAWLFAVFTPWKDCLVRYGGNKNYLFLGWGEHENIKYLTEHLPRAEDACSDNQMKLLNHAASRADKSVNYMFSHFPVINYADSVPLSPESFGNSKMEDRYSEIGKNTKYATGTVENNHAELIAHLTNKKIHYAISGHSHRPGVYRFTNSVYDSHSLTQLFSMRGVCPAPKAGLVNWLEQELPKDVSTVLVCGSSGPYCRQNLHGEFSGHGMDKPQGLVLNSAEGCVRFVKSRAAKPRLAVVLDYLWCVDGISPFMSLVFSDRPEDHWHICCPRTSNVNYWCKFNPKWIDIFKGNPIREITLHAVNLGNGNHHKCKNPLRVIETNLKNTAVFFDVTWKDMQEYQAQLAEDNENKSEYIYYFSVKLQDTAMKLSTLYNLQSPWCFPVRSFNKPKMHGFRRAIPEARYGYEVPNFNLLSDIDEYNRSRSGDSQ